MGIQELGPHAPQKNPWTTPKWHSPTPQNVGGAKQWYWHYKISLRIPQRNLYCKDLNKKTGTATYPLLPKLKFWIPYNMHLYNQETALQRNLGCFLIQSTVLMLTVPTLEFLGQTDMQTLAQGHLIADWDVVLLRESSEADYKLRLLNWSSFTHSKQWIHQGWMNFILLQILMLYNQAFLLCSKQAHCNGHCSFASQPLSL